METLGNCPVCNSMSFESFLTTKDFLISKTNFNIVKCMSCGFKLTNPRPDAKELGKYYKSEKYISHTETRKGLINGLYHFVRKYTLIKKLQLIIRICGNPIKTPKSILDIGCGTGAFLEICKRAGFNCKGIEPDEDARKLAKHIYGVEVLDEAALVDLSSASFDIITLWHVLEHVPFLNERIEKLKELLKPNGRVIVAVPNHISYDAIHYDKYWAGYDLPRHLYHFTPDSMNKLFKRHNMKLESVLPMRFDSFYVSMLSERNKMNKINYLKSVFIGLKSNLLAMRNGKEFSSQIYIIKLENK
jgi:SAM-dependent methyltransferase